MKRYSLLFSVLLGGLVFLGASGCAGGNPYLSDAEGNLEDENYEQALSNVDQALAQDSANAQAYLLRGRILQNQASTVQDAEQHSQLIEEAMQAFDRAVEINPDVRSDVNNQRFFAYQNEMNQGVEAFNAARESQSTEDYSRAAAYFGAAAALQPDSVSALLNEAYALINAERTEEAIDPLQRYVEGVEQPDSSDAQAYLTLSQLYNMNQQPEEAAAVLEEARAQFPDNPDIQAEALNTAARSGDTESAMQQYEQAIEREPENPTYRYNYGSMLLNTERYDEAIEQLTRAVELDPQYANAQYNLGAAYVNKAVQVNDQISQLNEDSGGEPPQAQVEEMTQERRSLFQEAIGPLETARQQVQNNPDASIQEGDICSALFSAYVQTNQQSKAEAIAECAGVDQ